MPSVADVRVLPGKCWGAAVASMYESGITSDEEQQLKGDVLGLETKTFLLHCIVPEDQQAKYGKQGGRVEGGMDLNQLEVGCDK